MSDAIAVTCGFIQNSSTGHTHTQLTQSKYMHCKLGVDVMMVTIGACTVEEDLSHRCTKRQKLSKKREIMQGSSVARLFILSLIKSVD